MNVLDFYDFKPYITELKQADEWSELYHNTPNDKKSALQSTKPVLTRANVPKNDLISLDLLIAQAKPVKDGDKYSVEKTLAKIEDDRLRAYLHYVFLLTARGTLYRGTAGENTRYCALVPIFLAAHKEYNNVSYEDWNKKDKFIKFALGTKLYEDITKWKDKPLSNELRMIARRNALVTPKGKEVKKTGWPYHSIKLDSSETLPGNSLFRHMWLQTWMANVEFRNEYMILDVRNWDLMPEAFDSVFTKPKVEEPVFVPPFKKREEDCIPW